MATTCKTCLHPQREEIDHALVAGRSCLSLAAQYGLSDDSVRNHARVHLPERLTRAREAAETAAAHDLLRQVREIQDRTLQALRHAEKGGDTRTLLIAVREARGNLGLLSRVLAAAEAAPELNGLYTPRWWMKTREAILDSLRPYPDARLAVAGALMVIEGVPLADPALYLALQ